MKNPRGRGRILKADGDAVYHCMSRVVDKRFIFGSQEKNVFLNVMRKLEAFCGVEVLTYCLMSNHFHILLRVPDKAKAEPLTESRLLELLPLIYGETQLMAIRQELERARESADPAWHGEILSRFDARRHVLSAFMRELKQRFTLWYNRSQRRQGTLWEEKFRSVLVEATGRAPLLVAAYIELNPVRAGLASDPGDYRWSGYAEAEAGGKLARTGIQGMLAGSGWGGKKEWSWQEARERYRLLLSEKGAAAGNGEGQGEGQGEPLTSEAPADSRTRHDRLTLGEALRRRVRYFTDGGALGSADFVEEVFQAHRHRLGPGRTSGPRRMRGGEWGAMRVMRDLQKNLYSP